MTGFMNLLTDMMITMAHALVVQLIIGGPTRVCIERFDIFIHRNTILKASIFICKTIPSLKYGIKMK
ncbi:MAG: hypothetical protein COA57_16225 [Flavobacteriales bacterium]|nr:MAG: hypothetical protein COA57_16225 [Flavobacteriales bacterium]